MLRIALKIAVVLLTLASAGNASAYSATAGSTEGAPGVRYRAAQTLSGPYGTQLFLTAAAACAGSESLAWAQAAGGGSGYSSAGFDGTYCRYNRTTPSYSNFQAGPSVGTVSSTCSTGYTNAGGTCTVYTCPGGGTLSGSTCTCAPGETDTGSACSACPAGQFKKTAGSACEAQCPEGQANGPASYAPSGSAGFCMDRQDFTVGIGWGDVATTTTVPKCKYGGTGISICADYGDAVSCYSETTYGLGTPCSTETTIPTDTPSTCDTGDLYCETSGACGTGFVAGTFNGKNLCVKTGETVTVTPRTSSALDPPKSVAPPASLPGGSSGGTVTTNPGGDVVVAVGPRASTVGGAGGSTGTGGTSGGGGTGEDIECGLPGHPKCQIDETGTPTGAGAYDSAIAEFDAKKTERVNAIDTVTSSSGKDTSWGFSFSPPTTCSPLSVSMGPYSFTLDPCPYQPVAHDIMSLIWAASTLFLCVGMVGRTIRAA